MAIFRKLAHLQEQLGDERFAALISSDNTGQVKEFCDELIEATIPTEMTINGVTYTIPHCLVGNEEYVTSDVFVARAKAMEGVALGKQDGQNLLEYEQDIPAALCEKAVFVFTEWRSPDLPEYFAIVYWHDGRWVQDWDWFDHNFNSDDRVLCRK